MPKNINTKTLRLLSNPNSFLKHTLSPLLRLSFSINSPSFLVKTLNLLANNLSIASSQSCTKLSTYFKLVSSFVDCISLYFSNIPEFKNCIPGIKKDFKKSDFFKKLQNWLTDCAKHPKIIFTFFIPVLEQLAACDQNNWIFLEKILLINFNPDVHDLQGIINERGPPPFFLFLLAPTTKSKNNEWLISVDFYRGDANAL